MLYGNSKTDVVSAPDSGQPRSYQDQKDCQRLWPGGAEVYLVGVNQSDKEEKRAQRDGPSQHGFHQQHCPAAQQEDMNEQPEDKTRENVCKFQIKRAKQHCSNTQRDN